MDENEKKQKQEEEIKKILENEEEPQIAVICFDEGTAKKLHPAITFFEDVCYVGTFLPVRIVETKRDNFEIKEKEMLCFISSNREAFPALKHELKKRNLILEQEGLNIGTRWSPESIKEFLQGKVSKGFFEIFEIIKTELKNYFEFPNELWFDVIASYIIATYFFKLFASFGILLITGVRQCGKTKLGDFISLLSFNSIKSCSITASGLFRSIHETLGTIVIEENEDLGKNPQRVSDLITILNAGYKDGTPVVKSVETKRGFKAQQFICYSPKVISNIYGIGVETLLDRCIILIMKRATDPKILNSEIMASEKKWQELRDELYLLLMNRWKDVEKEKDKIEINGLNSRQLEIWKPILCTYKLICEESGGKLSFENFCNFVLQVTKEKEILQRTEEIEEVILKALEELVSDDWLSVKEITEKVKEIEDWVNEKIIGRALTRLGFSEKRRTGRGGIQYKIRIKDYLDVCRRLGVDIDYNKLTERLSELEKTTQTTPDIEKTTPNKQETTPETTPKLHQENEQNGVVSAVSVVFSNSPTSSFDNNLSKEDRYLLKQLRETHSLEDAIQISSKVLCIDETRVRNKAEKLLKQGVISEVRPGYYVVNINLGD